MTRRQNAPQPLRRDTAERPLAAGETHAYTLSLRAGDGALVRAVQRGIDVVVRVHAPDGAPLTTVDVTGEIGEERIAFRAAVAGEHRLEVLPFRDGAPAGRYRLFLDRVVPGGRRRADRLRQWTALVADPDGPGAVAQVSRDGETLWRAAVGMADMEHGIRLRPDSVFHVASVSKQVTAFAVGLLARDGRLGYDDDIRRHLPQMRDFGTPITLRHLLWHTSGLRDQWEMLAIGGRRLDDVITQEDLRRLAFRQRELNFPPGERHLYSNTGYTLLAEIVARVSGKPFPRFVAERILAPLGMTRSHVHDDHRRLVPGRALSYGVGADGWEARPLNYANAGATSLFTTADDLTRWLRDADTRALGGDALWREMETPGRLRSGRTIPYGFGLRLEEHRGLRTVGHGGADAGYRTAVLRVPERRLAVVVLGNSETFDAVAAARDLADLFLDGAFPPPSPRPAPPPRPAPTPFPPPPPEALAAYAGTYASDEADTRYRISVRDGRLVAEHPRNDPVTLAPTAPDRFAGDAWFFGSARFGRDAAGKVDGLWLSGERVLELRFDRVAERG